MGSVIEIGIVVPCFNEANRFQSNYWKSIVSNNSNVQWLFVDDGSTDSTYEILRILSSKSNVILLKLHENMGKGNAIREGMKVLIGGNLGMQYIGYIDSDGAFSEYDIKRLIKLALEESHFDAVISSRVALSGRNVVRKPSRHYLGRIIATLLTRNWESAPYDTQSGFKLFKSNQHLNNAILDSFNTRWFVDIELICRLSLSMNSKLTIWEEPVNSWRDIDGSKIRLRNLIQIVREFRIARSDVKEMIKRGNLNGFN